MVQRVHSIVLEFMTLCYEIFREYIFPIGCLTLNAFSRTMFSKCKIQISLERIYRLLFTLTSYLRNKNRGSNRCFLEKCPFVIAKTYSVQVNLDQSQRLTVLLL